MKKIIKLLAVASLVLPFALSTVVLAETNKPSTTGKSDTSTHVADVKKEDNATTTDTKQEDRTIVSTTTAEPENDAKSMAERLVERKAAVKTKLTTIEQKHIQNVCKVAQTRAGTVNTQAAGLGSVRDKIYGDVVTRLSTVATKLKAKGVDTAQLDSEIIALKDQVATFDTDVTAYKQDVSDVVALDCVTDPTAFKLSLDAARTAREKVASDSTAMRTYVEGTIKPTLQQLREQLAKTATPKESK